MTMFTYLAHMACRRGGTLDGFHAGL